MEHARLSEGRTVAPLLIVMVQPATVAATLWLHDGFLLCVAFVQMLTSGGCAEIVGVKALLFSELFVARDGLLMSG